ncbi:hypothetical protein Glove_79g130 [Diversispora epigaea]|uniref:Cysteine protease n=1 Tax=Diversispora epigaea TaxID=1348612 RepID=A0A397JBU9_9GLOM|nr:hypothetical protein Glove_79g130 [Diversispora epigaea]
MANRISTEILIMILNNVQSTQDLHSSLLVNRIWSIKLHIMEDVANSLILHFLGRGYDNGMPLRCPFSNKDFQSILILVAIRLGINNLNPVYYDALKAYFRFPQSVGIAGGKPSSSYYFIGTQADGLFYLDPHHSRPAIELKSNDQLTEEELLTYHCDVPHKISISQLDPSMLLGFYCKTKDDFEDFCSRVEKIRQPVFTIAQEAPDYSDDDCGVFSEDDDEFDKSDDDRSDDDSDADNNFTEQVIELDNVID